MRKSCFKILVSVLLTVVVLALIFFGIKYIPQSSSNFLLVQIDNALCKVNENGKVVKNIFEGINQYGDQVDNSYFSKDGKRIIFAVIGNASSRFSSIWSVGTDGSEKVNLTEGFRGTFECILSTSKGRVVFESHKPFGIWAVNIDGTNRVNLAEGLSEPDGVGIDSNYWPYDEGLVLISKGEESVIFVAKNPKSNKDCFWYSKLDGTERKNLTGDLSVNLTTEDTVRGRYYTEFFSFSDDGNKILFDYSVGKNPFLRVMNLDGTDKVILPYGYSVSFVNDGKEIVLLRDGKSGRSIWKISINNKTQKNLTEDMKGDCYGTILSPSGDKILFEFAPEGSQEYSLWLMNIDGGGRKNLTEGMNGTVPVGSYIFSFLPQGDKALFLFQPENLQGKSLWVASLDSSQRTKLMEESDWGYYLEYVSPSGDNLLIRSENSLWFISTDSKTKEKLIDDINNTIFCYYLMKDSGKIIFGVPSQDNKSCTLYLMNLVNGNRAKIKDGFEGNISSCEVSKDGLGILIKSFSANGTLKYYLFNGKGKFLDLQNVLKSQVKFATYFPPF